MSYREMFDRVFTLQTLIAAGVFLLVTGTLLVAGWALRGAGSGRAREQVQRLSAVPGQLLGTSAENPKRRPAVHEWIAMRTEADTAIRTATGRAQAETDNGSE